MNKLGFGTAILAIVAAATWTYNVNYKTKMTLGRVDGLRGQIAAQREAIQVLRVEWAWLNNPERLARLAEMHSEELALVPLSPEAYGDVALIPEWPVGEEHEELLSLYLAEAGERIAALPGPPMGSALPPPRPAAVAE